MVALTQDETITVACRLCRVHHDVMVNMADVRTWMAGTLIQDAMPYLSADDRELLISHTCGKCWENMFGNCENS